jgi:hypothetical protein
MARRSSEPPEDYTLYDIDPRFQESLMKWLAKKNIVIDIGPNPRGTSRFHVTFDPGGEIYADSFELAILEAMGSKARTRHIDPQLEVRVHEFMVGQSAHITFGANKNTFNVVVAGPDATGKAADEDMELALVFAEEDYWDNMPAHPLAPAQRAELASALLEPRAQREEEAEGQLRRALFEPRPELEANRQKQSYALWIADVDESLVSVGAHAQDMPAEYWRQLYQVGFAPYEAAQEFLETSGAGYEENAHPQRGVARWQRPFTYALPPTPPSEREHRVAYPSEERDDKPFDPSAPREHYARAHHFAVNARWTRAYINSLPDTAFLYVEPGGSKDGHGRSHPLSLRHLPYKNRAGAVDRAHLAAALARSHQGRTKLPRHVKETVFKKGEAIYEREFGHAVAANPGYSEIARGMESGYGSWRIELADGDINPSPFGSYDEAQEYARQRYGASGWTVAWHARDDEEEPVGRGSLLSRHGYR